LKAGFKRLFPSSGRRLCATAIVETFSITIEKHFKIVYAALIRHVAFFYSSYIPVKSKQAHSFKTKNTKSFTDKLGGQTGHTRWLFKNICTK